MLAIATTRAEPRTSPGQLEELRPSPGQLEDESLSLIGHCGVVNVSSRRLRSAVARQSQAPTHNFVEELDVQVLQHEGVLQVKAFHAVAVVEVRGTVAHSEGSRSTRATCTTGAT